MAPQAARAELEAAHELFEELGDDLHVAEVATNLGNLPEALKFGMADSTKRQPRKEFLNASAPKGDTTSWDEVKDLASFWEFTKELAGGSAGFIAPAAAAAKAGFKGLADFIRTTVLDRALFNR